jgi:hypothetical protein
MNNKIPIYLATVGIFFFLATLVTAISIFGNQVQLTQEHDTHNFYQTNNLLNYINTHVYIQNDTVYIDVPFVIITKLDTLVYIWRQK